MNRIALRLIVAVALVALGWSIGWVQNRVNRTQQLFSLNIEAPIGSTTIRCDGCDLLTWNAGRATVRRQFTLVCNGPEPCSEILGGTMPAPRQIADIGPYANGDGQQLRLD